MHRGTRVSTDQEIRQWWKRIKARHQIFFHLISDEAPAIDDLQNVKGFILQLAKMYEQIENDDCPEKAQKIRSYLLKAAQHLRESLEKMHDNQLLESEIRMEGAKVDYSLVQSELLKRGIGE